MKVCKWICQLFNQESCCRPSIVSNYSSTTIEVKVPKVSSFPVVQTECFEVPLLRLEFQLLCQCHCWNYRSRFSKYLIYRVRRSKLVEIAIFLYRPQDLQLFLLVQVKFPLTYISTSKTSGYRILSGKSYIVRISYIDPTVQENDR